jgi:hypothetical protein
VGAALRPSHLRLLAEAVADHLIHGGLYKAGADPFALPIALTVVGNETLLVLDISMELLDRFQQLSGGVMATAASRAISTDCMTCKA